MTLAFQHSSKPVLGKRRNVMLEGLEAKHREEGTVLRKGGADPTAAPGLGQELLGAAGLGARLHPSCMFGVPCCAQQPGQGWSCTRIPQPNLLGMCSAPLCDAALP